MHYKDALILMERNEVTQCGVQMENWNGWNKAVWAAACVDWND